MTFETNRSPQPTVCSICQRPAIGYHCGVASCKGCKTFFRRMCVSERSETKCLVGNDQCFSSQHPHVLRCRSCRYQKCILVGMNPLALELKEDEQKALNYQKLTKRASNSAESDEEVNSQKQLVKALVSVENKMQKTIDMLAYLESKLEMFRCSAYNPRWDDVKGLSHLLVTNSNISLAEKMGPMPGWPLAHSPNPLGPRDDNFWKSLENCLPKFHATMKQWMFYDLMTTVEYAKTFDFLHKLDMKDRRILLGNVALACTNLHISQFTVESKFEKIVNPDGTMLPFIHGKFGYSWTLAIIPLIRCRITRTEYILLKSICLCNPAVPNLSQHAQDIISSERAMYSRTLLDHCQRTRSNGVAHFGELIGILGVLERQQRMQKDLHLVHVAPFIARIPDNCKIELIDDIMNF